MTKYYNPENGGFYDLGVNISADADVSQMVELSDADYLQLIQGQGKNGAMIKNVDGRPTLGYPDPPDTATTAALNTRQKAALMQAAMQGMAPLQAAIDLGIATEAETALMTQWKTYMVTLNRLDLTVVPLVWPTTPSDT